MKVLARITIDGDSQRFLEILYPLGWNLVREDDQLVEITKNFVPGVMTPNVPPEEICRFFDGQIDRAIASMEGLIRITSEYQFQ